MIPLSLNQRNQSFLLIGVGLVTLPLFEHLPVALSGFFSVLWSWRFVVVWRPEWLPTRWVLFLLTLSAITLLIIQRTGVFGRNAGTAIIVVALALKLMEIRCRRDTRLIVYLAYIVAASVFLFEQRIWMSAYLGLICVLLSATLMLETSPEITIPAALKTALALFLQALPLAAVMFVVFPRLEAPRWMWLRDDNSARSGLSEVLQPGSISQLSLSDELAFRVKFEGDLPPQSQRYWRGPVYVKTDGTTWTAEKSDAPAEDITFTAPDYRYTLLMEPQKENWVYALDRAKALESHVRRNANHELMSLRKPGERAEYVLTSSTSYNTGLITDKERRDNLQLPGQPSAKLNGLIKRLGGFDHAPTVFIANVLHHFNTDDFHYTLTPPLMADNPIETFLFDTRSGFCSHYATAFVYLLRIAGIPARVVGGYQGGEFNDVGGFLEVRQADAHAWAEVWLAGRGWVRFDPTAAVAPERIERGVNVPLQVSSGAVNFGTSAHVTLAWLYQGRRLWQSLDYQWQRWVVNYSGNNQMRVWQALGIDDWRSLAQWLSGVVLVVVSPLVWVILRRNHRKTDTVLTWYRRFCRKLAARGLSPVTGEGPLAFADRVKRSDPDLAAAVDRITTLFVRLRYQSDPMVGDLHDLKQAVREFRLKP